MGWHDQAVDDEAVVVQDVGVRLLLGNESKSLVGAAAAVGAERDDNFAREIVLLKEGVKRHRQLIPPNRIANEDNVVGLEVDWRQHHDFRMGALVQL